MTGGLALSRPVPAGFAPARQTVLPRAGGAQARFEALLREADRARDLGRRWGGIDTYPPETATT